MQKYDSQIMLSSLIGSDIRAAYLLDIFKLNFSGSEDQSLKEAAEEAGASHELIIDALNRYLSKDFFPSSSISSITSNVISIHHGFLWKALPIIEELFQQITLSKDLDEAKQLFSKVAQNIRNHSREEEQSFFPALNELESNKESAVIVERLNETVTNMETEHQACQDALSTLRFLTSDFAWNKNETPEYRQLMQRLRILDFDLKFHIYKENNLLHRKLRQISGIDQVYGSD